MGAKAAPVGDVSLEVICFLSPGIDCRMRQLSRPQCVKQNLKWSETVWNRSLVGVCLCCSSSYDVYDLGCVANRRRQLDLSEINMRTLMGVLVWTGLQ